MKKHAVTRLFAGGALLSGVLLVMVSVAGFAADGNKPTSGKKSGSVTLTRAPLTIPTYEIGRPDPNAIFFTGRVYQGAQGHVYPYAMLDILTDHKVDKKYNALNLENEYIKIGILPELGGRLHIATDKTNGYNFFYLQHVVKPALIGMLGAWISGGVEWNIPHHHRPSTFMPIDWTTTANKDGSKTVWVGETELRHRLKWTVGITVFPDRNCVEAHIKIMNRSPFMQSMLCWANVSVHCDENYQVIFPPTVQHGTGHSKISFVDWPINNGIDYSMWKNHTDEFRSVFAWDFKEDFLAGYDHAKHAGTVHFANHYQVGGKKFFLWGNHERAKMWDKMLTDDDGCYLELMVGAYSNNQPDYSWLAPGEVRDFRQYWFPITGIEHVKNANLEGAVNLERTKEGAVFLGFSPTMKFEGAKATLLNKGHKIWEKTFNTEPGKAFTATTDVPASAKTTDLTLVVQNAKGKELIRYTPPVLQKEETPAPVEVTKAPKDYKSNEELYLVALRMEQFHNAKMDPVPFYEEVLRRDPGDARTNTAMGLRAAKQGKWPLAEQYLKKAIERLGHNYTELRDGEPHYNLGVVYKAMGDFEKAKSHLWKATWTTGYQSVAFFTLAQIAATEHDYKRALEMIDESLNYNQRNTKSMVLRAFILRKLKKNGMAAEVLTNCLKRDPLDYWALCERSFLSNGDASFLKLADDTRGADLIKLQEMLEMAVDYGNVGAWDEAIALLKEAVSLGKPYADSPLPYYYLGYYTLKRPKSDVAQAKKYFALAAKQDPAYCFPFRVEERDLFDTVLKTCPEDAKAAYLYGDLLYYLEDKDAGMAQWTRAVALRPELARAWRNLGFAWDRKGDIKKAIDAYEKALKWDKTDPRVYTELDILYARIFKPASERLAIMNQNLSTVMKHDDAVARLCGLYNETGNFAKSLKIFDSRHFHVWEGGRAVHNMYVDAHLLSGLKNRDDGRFDAAVKDFQLAQSYPANLEVGRVLDGGQNAKVLYYLATVYDARGDKAKAAKAYEESASQANAPRYVASELTFYQIMSLKKLKRAAEADKLLAAFEKAVRERYERRNSVDEFSKFGEEGTVQERLAISHYLFGLVYQAQGDKKKAAASFDDALKLNPNLIWPKIVRKD